MSLTFNTYSIVPAYMSYVYYDSLIINLYTQNHINHSAYTEISFKQKSIKFVAQLIRTLTNHYLSISIYFSNM